MSDYSEIKRGDVFKFGGLVALIILFIILVIYLNYYGIIDSAKIQDQINEFGNAAPIIYIFILSVALITFFPVTVVIILGVILFGGFWGSIYSIIGSVIGAIISFYIARFLGKRFIDVISEIKYKRIKKYNKQIKDNGFLATLVFRLSPVLHYSSLSYLLGLTKIHFWDYFFGTLIGVSVWIFAVAYLSDALINLKTMDIIISAFLFLILFFIIPINEKIKKFIKRLKKKTKKK